MKNITRINARAKLTFTLDVLGKNNGMHLIDSVVMPIDLFDEVALKINGTDQNFIKYSNRESAYPFDTALRMADLIKTKYVTGGVDIVINKRIPERAGLGGSSADAAAVARGMEELFDIKVDSGDLLDIGSDVNAMYVDAPCILAGIGERVEVIDAISPNIVLLILDSGVDTGECYHTYDVIGGKSGNRQAVLDGLREGKNFFPYNALTESAISLNAEIKEAIKILGEYFDGSMTGSGSAVFGIEYDDLIFDKKVDGLKKSVGNKYKIMTFRKKEK